MRDPKTGKRYVMKHGASPEHIRSEADADNLYRAVGENVPSSQLYDSDEPVKLSEYHDDFTPFSNLSGKARSDAIEKARKGFATDALAANHDVAGIDFDNLQIDKDGKVWRIDNGGSFGFRAQGSKDTGWNEHPTELWSMQDADINPRSAEVFSDINHDRKGS